jgi:hypothetical protein
MAEGLLGGILGGEEDEKTAPARAGTEAFAAAVATNIANHSPEVAAKTAAFFEEQTELVKAQRKSVETEHEYFEVEWGPRLLALRLRTGFQIFLVLFATVIGVGVAIVIYEAVQSRSVVIESFSAPPSLAVDGLSGQVLASGLLDVLTRIQAASRANIEHRNLSNAWTNEIAIDVPETGISIGQLERMIKTRFGHDQHIQGDLVKTPMGLALTVRGTGILPKTFTGEAGALDKLLTQAGEYVFGQSQPGLWAAYLSNNDRNDEAIRFAQGAYNAVDASEPPSRALKTSESRRLTCRCATWRRRPCGSKPRPSMRRTCPTSRRRRLIGRCSPKRGVISRQRRGSGTPLRWPMPTRRSPPPIHRTSAMQP